MRATAGDTTQHRRYTSEVDAERLGWDELAGLVRRLTLDERLEPGYYRNPDWSVRDLVAHVGTWLAEAQIQLERIDAGTYAGHDVDIDGLNASFLEAMRDQPWGVTWAQASAARSRMVAEWFGLEDPSAEAAWWIHKSGSEHYHEHVPHLHAWVEELIGRRPSGYGQGYGQDDGDA
jgi:hypothetical protein